MPMRLSVPRRVMVRDINDHCNNMCRFRTRHDNESFCCKPACPLYKYRATNVPQMDLFRISLFPDFVTQIISLTAQMPTPFWWSQVRQEAEKLHIVPMNERWWGNVTRTKQWKTRYRLTRDSRPSPIARNKGSAEFQWDQRLDVQHQTSVA